MMQARLTVDNVQISFLRGDKWHPMVDGASFSIYPGEMLALIGESGCGKSITAMSLLGLLPSEVCRISAGQAVFEGKNLYGLSQREIEVLRGNEIAMIFQEPMTALNPVFTVGYQLEEILICHRNLSKEERYEKCVQLLDATGIPAPAECLKKYPFELSGGMRQRVMIAMAVACEPKLLIADEPTTALDVTVQAQIMTLLRSLQKQFGTSVLFITHNLALASQYADRCCVMYAGQIMEMAANPDLFLASAHPYTKLLMESIPHYSEREKMLSAIQGMPPANPSEIKGCRFGERCPWCDEICRSSVPKLVPFGQDGSHAVRCHHVAKLMNLEKDSGQEEARQRVLHGRSVPLLSVRDLCVHFPIKTGFLKRTTGWVKAVDGVSFELNPGETVALVGESGCGKTTVGKALIRLIAPTGGSIELADAGNLAEMTERQMRPHRQKIQMIFQDPFSSLNPRLTVGESIAEGMLLHHQVPQKMTLQEALKRLMAQVGLPENALNRYPHQFSGGQRQRIGLARALAVCPEIIICDECTSALDVSVQAQIINLLKSIQQETGVAYLFITHDLGVVGYLANRVCVMYLGRLVEVGTVEDIYQHARHPYTKMLLAAAPDFGYRAEEKAAVQRAEIPNPAAPPAGCAFQGRCPYATEKCREGFPPVSVLSSTHSVRCFLE